MKLGILVVTITSSILLVACGSSNFQFGNTVPNSSSETHNDLGNVQENTQMNILAPLSENAPSNETLVPIAPVKVVRPKRLKPATNATASLPTEAIVPELTPPSIEQIAQPAPSNWQPNEALLIRGNELLNGLQREIGKKPTITQMQKRLQTHMGLTEPQAQEVIAKLGLLQ